MNMTISLDRFRSGLKSVCDRVCLDHEPVLVTRRNGDDVVVISKEDYSAMLETFYLMRSPANAKRLNEAVGRDRSEQITFTNTDDLRNEVGL